MRSCLTAIAALGTLATTGCGGAEAPQIAIHGAADMGGAPTCGGVEACIADCDRGRGESCYGAGAIYETGSGALQSYGDAARFYDRACAAGEPRGCNNLGVMREIGLAGAQDYSEAAGLYRKACDGGDAQGCANLALRYEEGLGVPHDTSRSKELLQQACSRGNEYACRRLE